MAAPYGAPPAQPARHHRRGSVVGPLLLIFVGGAVAGIPGLILVLPLAGVVMVIAGTIGGIIDDPRLRARHGFAKRLRSKRINADLQC